MASRAEPVPGFAATLRLVAGDAYAESLRLLAANLVWGLALLAWGTVVLVVPPLVMTVPVLALPTASLFVLTTSIARGGRMDLGAALGIWRRRRVALAILTVAALGLVLGAVLAVDGFVGLTSGTPLGWAFATVAGWGLLALWLVGWTAAPLLVDPVHGERPVRDRLVLAALVVLAHPFRSLAMGILLAIVLILSIVAILPLLTISMALAALVATRLVLPVADRLAARRRGDPAEAPSAP